MGDPVVEIRGLGVYFRLQQRSRMSIRKALLGGGLRRNAPVIWALREVDLTCHEGQVVGVIGPNGAGKSTLCLVLSRILEPDEGSVAVRGHVSTLLSLGAGFNRELSGRENILLNAAFLGIPRKEIGRRMDAITEFADLGEFIDQPIRFYSNGMRSRLGFAIATSLDPEILVLDEVLSVGDRAFRAKSQARIESMMARSRLIVIVSHATSFLRKVCTHCLWLDRGRVRRFGPAAEVLDAYEQEVGGIDVDPSVDASEV
jgi:ABC-type polysaccharide/polyol phosphate transport system ATPase subunit